MSAPGGDLGALLARGHSPRFHAALASLLRAYHADLEAARLDWQAGVKSEEAIQSDVKFEDAIQSGGTGVAARSKPGELSEVLFLTASRSACMKHADTPVHGQSDFETDDSSGFKGSESCQELGLAVCEQHFTSETADKSTSRRQTPDLATVPRSRSSVDHHRQHLENLMERTDVRCTLKDIVQSGYFEVGSAVIILIFCLLTALEMQKQGLRLGYELGWPHYRQPETTASPEVGDVLEILMFACGAIFALEVLVRCAVAWRQFFYDWWNYFDITILIAWAVEIIGAESIGGMHVMRSLRLLRLLRFIQLFRFVQRLENLYFLMQAMRSSLKILLWYCVLLFVIQSITAFLISQLLFTFYFHDASEPWEERSRVFEYFGSFSRSLLTTFEMAMGNWPVPARVLFENVSEWFVILFLAHKMTVGLSVVGIINAVFVQETLRIATFDDVTMVQRKRKQAKLMKEKLHRLFCAADDNEDGRISRKEFGEVLDHADVRIWLASMDFDCKCPGDLFSLLDQDGDNYVTSEEFFDGMTSLRGHARAMDLLQVIEEVHKLRNFLGDVPTSPPAMLLSERA